MKHLTWLLFLLVSLMAAACDEAASPTAHDTGSDISAIPFEPGVFPNALGTIWIYRRHDLGSDLYDTVEVRVSDTMTAFGGYPEAVWTFIRKNHVMDIQYVLVADDTMMFAWWPWSGPSPQQPNLIFHFPAPVGQFWMTPYGDSTAVTGIGPLDVPAGHFDDVTTITRITDHRPDSRYWLKPHVGILRMENPKNWPGAPYEEWTLIRFIP